uniref:Uncharacterized protein n=1 Tax=Rhizophora mucronata TaxID=61149 RepID=A0A2P2QYE8_RHIMU
MHVPVMPKRGMARVAARAPPPGSQTSLRCSRTSFLVKMGRL